MDRIETLALLKSEEEIQYSPPTISEWVYSLYDVFCKTGNYPYLREVNEWIVKTEKLELSDSMKKKLETLIYNVAHKWREDKKREAGFNRATSEVLEALLGKLVEIYSEGLIGESIRKFKVFKRVDGVFFLMKPRARRRGIVVYHDTWIRKAA